MNELRCDYCNHPIKNPSDGWIQWFERYIPEKGIHYSCRAEIVHKTHHCMRDRSCSALNDLELHNHITAEGITVLKEHFRQTKLPDDEAHDIIRRIQAAFMKKLVKSTPEQRRRYRERARVTKSVRYDVLKHDGFQCVLCGASGKDSQLVIDHNIPIADGGTSDRENLQTVCSACNEGKGAKL